MLDKIYQVVEFYQVGKDKIKIIDTFGCFITIEEARKFVEEFLLEYFNEPFEPSEESDGCLYCYCVRNHVIAIVTELVGFDNCVDFYQQLRPLYEGYLRD